MDTKIPPTLSAPVLGQLLLMQSVLGQLPDEPAIFSFVCRGLQDLPGIADARHAAAPGEVSEGSLVRFPLRMGDSQWGELVLKVSDPSAFAPYALYLTNFCFMLSVLLEERQQRRLNEQHQAQLEQRVQERTQRLTEEVTERQRTEAALREKEHLLSESQRIAHIGSWCYDLTGRLSWSDEMYSLYGVSPGTFVPNAESFLNLINNDDRPAMQAWIAACAAGEKPGDLEFRINLPDGTVRYISG
ncbi:MAG: PAS domain-containing protein, partial [Desulfobacterales bacterium]|nr:PAS domain-containing protein [Desulfobacterales bacterium]